MISALLGTPTDLSPERQQFENPPARISSIDSSNLRDQNKIWDSMSLSVLSLCLL
jgi:hypothetical protein